MTWISSDTNVATVARGGLVEGRKAGRVLITAKWESARGSATVVVLDRVSKKPASPLVASLARGRYEWPGETGDERPVRRGLHCEQFGTRFRSTSSE